MDMLDLLKSLNELQGSDLHLLAGLVPAFRIHGELIPQRQYQPLSGEEIRTLVYSILTPEQIRCFESDPNRRNELDFSYGIPGMGRFRVNVHRQRGTIAATIRALSMNIPKVGDLGLPEAILRFTKAQKGLFLVTGPTGSGKSTTLAALVDVINSERRGHIITIEDPIEYLHRSKKSYITQREVGPAGDTLSFRTALKYALRQDPDIILIGEMRDYETIAVAISSAETGHLVLGSLHTMSAAQTVDRIVDSFPSDQQNQVRIQLAANLIGVISQVLLPRADKPGRVMACELMVVNYAVRNLIRQGKTEALLQTMQSAMGDGMQTLDQSLLSLFNSGKIDYETARPFIQDATTHEKMELKGGLPPSSSGKARSVGPDARERHR
jgi:twitching motility protein PilT